MNVLETEWWTLALPPEWWAEAEGESILIGDRDGVGSIEISTLHKERDEFDPAEVAEIAAADSGPEAVWQPATLGEYAGVTTSYLEEEAALREWYVANGSMMLFITYSCDAENRGMDDAAVDELLDTLMAVTK